MTITIEARTVEDFKVGDIVVLDTTGFNAAIPAGAVGEVVEIEGNFIDVEFVHPDTLKTVRLPAYADEIVLQQPEEQEPLADWERALLGYPVGINVGDRVQHEMGTTGTVTEVRDTNANNVTVLWDEGSKVCAGREVGTIASALTVLPPKPEFKDGDRVIRVSEKHLAWGGVYEGESVIGSVGTVTGKDYTGKSLNVTWDEDTALMTSSVIDPECVEHYEPTFREGDDVIVHADAKTTNGTGVYFGGEVSGTVTDLADDGDVLVERANGILAQWVAPKYLRHILVGEVKSEPEIVSNDELIGATVEDVETLDSLPYGTILQPHIIYRAPRVKAGGKWLYLHNGDDAYFTRSMVVEEGALTVEYIPTEEYTEF